MAKLVEGRKAPAFSLADKDGNTVKLSDVESEFTVVYFYPRDNTPGCTIEAKGFTKDLGKFEKLDTTVIGISGGDAQSKEKFCRKHNLKVTLLSDPDFKVSKKYGAYGDKSFMGKKSQGIIRKTFVLDNSNTILKIFHKVRAEGHSSEVIDVIRDCR